MHRHWLLLSQLLFFLSFPLGICFFSALAIRVRKN